MTDRGSIFLSSFWQELFKSLGTALHMSTSYHPQTDGQTERINACLESYLRCMTSHKPKQCFSWLSLAEWWFNTNFHSGLHMSPFQALYGYTPPQLALPPTVTTPIAAVQDHITHRKIMTELLREALHSAQVRYKHYADQKRIERTFEVDDWVYLKLQSYRPTSVALR